MRTETTAVLFTCATMGKNNVHTDFFAARPAAMDHAQWGRGVHMRKINAEASTNLVFQQAIEAGKATLWYGASGACRIIGAGHASGRAGTSNRGVIHHHRNCHEGRWALDGTRTAPPRPQPRRRPRGPGPREHPAGARARARAAGRPA